MVLLVSIRPNRGTWDIVAFEFAMVLLSLKDALYWLRSKTWRIQAARES